MEIQSWEVKIYKRKNLEFIKTYKPFWFYREWQRINPVRDRILLLLAILDYRAENSNENRKRNLRKIYRFLKKYSENVKASLKIS